MRKTTKKNKIKFLIYIHAMLSLGNIENKIHSFDFIDPSMSEHIVQELKLRKLLMSNQLFDTELKKENREDLTIQNTIKRVNPEYELNPNGDDALDSYAENPVTLLAENWLLDKGVSQAQFQDDDETNEDDVIRANSNFVAKRDKFVIPEAEGKTNQLLQKLVDDKKKKEQRQRSVRR